MAKSPKKNVAGSNMGAAYGAFRGLTSGNPITMATTFAAAFSPVLADIPSMINPSAASKAAAQQRQQKLLAENEERRLRKQREREQEAKEQKLKKAQEEKEAKERYANSQKATKEKTLQKDTKRIASRMLTQKEALKALQTGEMPEARSVSRFEEAELNSAFTRRRRRQGRRSKVKGGGTKKVCLPAAKIRSMSKSERSKVTGAKSKAAAGGKYKRSSKSFVKGARKKGATLRNWFQKEDWRQVGNPSKKCGEK